MEYGEEGPGNISPAGGKTHWFHPGEILSGRIPREIGSPRPEKLPRGFPTKTRGIKAPPKGGSWGTLNVGGSKMGGFWRGFPRIRGKNLKFEPGKRGPLPRVPPRGLPIKLKRGKMSRILKEFAET